MSEYFQLDCCHCGFPISTGETGLRHFGHMGVAHREDRCRDIMQGEIERLRAEVKRKNDALGQILAIENTRNPHLGMPRMSGIEKGCIVCIAYFALDVEE